MAIWNNPVQKPVGERYDGRTQICVEGLLTYGVYAHSVLVVDRDNTLAPETHKHISQYLGG